MPQQSVKLRLSSGRKRSKPINLSKALIKAANSDSNLLSNLNELEHYRSEVTDRIYIIKSFKYEELSEELFLWMINLLEINMADLYRSTEWGWDSIAKKKEMSNRNSRFLVAYSDVKSTPVAFSHFRFDIDNRMSVLYCYELQLDKSARKQGLAKHLMIVLESLSAQYRMSKVILTVFKNNKIAVDFFLSQGYKIDATSPENFSIQTFYSILSKNTQD